MSYLREYQKECVNASLAALSNGTTRTLTVLPTGCGKTECFLELADKWPDGEVLILSHRQELVYQPHERWYKKTGQYSEIVMADSSASTTKGRSKVICASVQTLYREGRLRHTFPDPRRVGLVIIDEAHHAVKSNRTYSRILEYLDHPNLRVYGTTATPDRTDEMALGELFQSVAFEYPLFDPDGGPSAIGDAWLVPIEQHVVTVEDLNFSSVKTRGGDFIESSLEHQMMVEKVLHKICAPTIQLSNDQPTLVFTAGIAQAISMAEIFNRTKTDSAMAMASRIPEGMEYDFVIDSGDKDERRRHLRRFGAGSFQYLCNMGVFTEGYDEPRIGVISMGRPTKSRLLYSQMVGRGTRPLSGTIEWREGDEVRRHESPEARRNAIALSGKPKLMVLDFVGNARFSLISSADILGGTYSDDVVERAKQNIQRKGAGDVRIELRKAQDEIHKELDERRRIQARAQFRTQVVDPFGAIGVVPSREPGWHKGRLPSERMRNGLAKFKVEDEAIQKMTFWEAKKMMGKLIERAEAGLCTYKQAKTLTKYGERTNVTFEEASSRIDMIAKNGWKPLPDAGMEREPGEEG